MVVVGVDPHKHTHTAVAVDHNGRELGQLTVKARAEGHRRLITWAGQFTSQFPGPIVWGVEDCRQVGGRLVRDLIAAGEEVVTVPTKLMALCRASARTRGKSDPIDALAVARGVLREPDLPRAHLDPDALEIRLLLDHREDLVGERTRMINRLRWHLVDLDPDLEPPGRVLTSLCRLRALAASLTGLPDSPRRRLAAELVDRILADTDRINELERELKKLVTPQAPALLAIPGVAELTAAKFIGEVAGIDRFHRPAQLANIAGTACIPVWTGNYEKHRLNRGGNRQLNAALHRVAVTQVRYYPPAQQLVKRRREQHHDTKAGALRVLKRHLVDVVFKAMREDQQRRNIPQPATSPHAA
jgi:transposase